MVMEREPTENAGEDKSRRGDIREIKLFSKADFIDGPKFNSSENRCGGGVCAPANAT